MESNTAWQSAYSTDFPGFPSNPSDQTAPEATLRLTREVSMAVIMPISLGLWASIWVAVATLAAARLL